MNEENNVVKPEKKKKKRSFWWLWLLLILVVFAGGVVVGLKLNTMPVPYEIVNRYFPQLAPAQNETAEQAPEAEPVPSPVPTAEPEAAAAPAPTEEPKPVETTVPAESAAPEEAVLEEEEAEPAFPEETAPASETTEEPKESMKPVFGKKDEPEASESNEEVTAPDRPIGIDKALQAALDHAGVRQISAEVTGVYKTVDIDTTVYAVEFTVNGTAYEYFINAVTGEVEGWRSTRASADTDDAYFYPDTPDIEQELFPAINRAKKSR